MNVIQYIITLFVRGNQSQAYECERQNVNGWHCKTQCDGGLDNPFWGLSIRSRVDRFGPACVKATDPTAGELYELKELRQPFPSSTAFEWQRVVVREFKQAMGGALMKTLVGPRFKMA